MALKIIIEPTSEPITVAEAANQLRIDSDDDYARIASLITSARRSAEHATGRALMPQTLELALDCFHGVIRLPRPPLASVTSIKYVDEAGVLQTLTDYQLDDYSEPACLTPAYGETWPATRVQPNAVLIRYVAGYANAAAVPQEIKDWMLLHIGTLYEHRETVIAGAPFSELPQVDRLLDPVRMWNI